MQRWIFFDLGSTLVDESVCYEKRYREIIENTDITLGEFKEKVREYAAKDGKADHAAAGFFGLQIPAWHKELELLYPESYRILKYLTQKGYKLGVIANQSTGTEERLVNWKIRKYFDVVLASAEEGVSKPDSEIFRRALERANCISGNAYMIGDRLDNDIAPAKTLGMKTVWIKQGFAKYSETVSGNADYTVNNLMELKDIL